jgi:hypothetical protein
LRNYAFSGTRIIDGAAFTDLETGPTLYNLTGSGPAAATILHDGETVGIEGFCSLNVQVGQSVAPNWDGFFEMSSDIGSLLFEADGAIQSDGTLTGNQTFYNMMVHGLSFPAGTLTAEEIRGHLVGPGLPDPDPVTGAFGSFTFTHGPDAEVTGGFATDLTVPLLP